jgi:hypothetical protein
MQCDDPISFIDKRFRMATSRAATPGDKSTDHKGVKRSNRLSCLAQD